MKDGYLLVDKAAGPTAHDVVDSVRRGLGIRRVGHTGTLDPFATGVLVLLIGRATRLSQYLVGLRKSYAGTMRLGVSTDSHDLTGAVVAESDDWKLVSQERIESEVSAAVGYQDQVPPKYSAKKVGGKRAYRLARSGEQVELTAKEIEVYEFAVTEVSGPDLSFECTVSSGTYVRAMARDLGRALGCGAHLRSLRRTAVGPFGLDRAQTLEEILEGGATIEGPAGALADMPRYDLESEEVKQQVVHGRPVEVSADTADRVALFFGDDLIAVAERQGALLKPKVVLEG